VAEAVIFRSEVWGSNPHSSTRFSRSEQVSGLSQMAFKIA
jgi:hypothetical protein